MKKNQRGMTLIALVITIVVLLILVAVNIAMIAGNNSLLNRTQSMVTENEFAEARDDIGLAYNSAYADYMSEYYANGKSNAGTITGKFLAKLEDKEGKYTLWENATIPFNKNADKYKNYTVLGDGKTTLEVQSESDTSKRIKFTIKEDVSKTTVNTATLIWEEGSEVSDDISSETVTLSSTKVDVEVGKTTTITVKDKGEKIVSCLSDDTKVATVNVNAEVITIKGEAKGRAIITVTTESGKTGICIVKVEEPKTVGNYTTVVSGNTKTKDRYGNPITIPAGFRVVIQENDDFENGISATNYTFDTIDVTKGIVVADKNNNQFVWIPVGDKIKKSDGTTVEIKLGRYVFDRSNGNPTIQQPIANNSTKTHISNVAITIGTYKFTEYQKIDTTSNTKAKDINAFYTSAVENGGYYIARYEAGIENYDSSKVVTTKDGTTTFNGYSNAGGNLVVKLNRQMYNYVTQTAAATIAKGMYTGKTFTSDLVNSYAWDTATVFIEKCGTKIDDDLSSNYANQIGYSSINSQKTGANMLKYIVGGTKDRGKGNYKVDEQCNIYDMAGNAREWTTENSNCTDKPGVIRGGSYTTTNDYIANRSSGSMNGCFYNIGFRPLLYIDN